ncbi:MAG: D-alanine--D-alanine ligase [Alphaproteobacteria bacterium GM202ARS2]|nr:D-alanine--D-alanine ligase [Alphaproteobacteria bacterium GM202ARS2]
MTRTPKIAVLMGGRSVEREVSMASGQAVSACLKSLGYQVVAIDAVDVRAWMPQLAGVDKVFNALHGRFGEDGCIQGMLELLAIPYTHSGVLASALAMDKYAAQQVFEHHGLLCPEMKRIKRCQLGTSKPFDDDAYVVKPVQGGSSVGVYVIQNDTDVQQAIDDGDDNDVVLVQRCIHGRELSVAIMGDKALGIIEIITERGFYDYQAKYDEGGSRHVIADIPHAVSEHLLRASLHAHRCLGCRSVSRVDWRLAEDGLAYLLEVNSQPGMTKVSLLPEIAAHKGIDFTELVSWIVDNACLDEQDQEV